MYMQQCSTRSSAFTLLDSIAHADVYGNPACWPTTASSYHSYQLVQHATNFCFKPFHAMQPGNARLKNIALLFQDFHRLHIAYNNIVPE